MWARTWVPRPSRNRPLVASASSQATCAVTIGLRGNATATPVRMSMSAASAAAAQERYAVRPASVTTRPAKPASAASRASCWTSRSGRPPVMTSSFTSDPRRRATGAAADQGSAWRAWASGLPWRRGTPTFYGPPPDGARRWCSARAAPAVARVGRGGAAHHRGALVGDARRAGGRTEGARVHDRPDLRRWRDRGWRGRGRGGGRRWRRAGRAGAQHARDGVALGDRDPQPVGRLHLDLASDVGAP